MINNITQFEKELRDFDKEIEREGVKKLKEMGSDAFDALLRFSPVKNGTYILSHRIGINAVSQRPFTFSFADTGSKLRARAEISNLQQVQKMKDKIIITNQAPHALNVEYGWLTHFGYAPFARTEMELRTKYGDMF